MFLRAIKDDDFEILQALKAYYLKQKKSCAKSDTTLPK